jgi:hypothetical protein
MHSVYVAGDEVASPVDFKLHHYPNLRASSTALDGVRTGVDQRKRALVAGDVAC